MIGYRHHDCLTPSLSLPKFYEGHLSADEIQGKARVSSATTGVFFAFSMAVLAVVMGSKDYRQTLVNGLLAWRTLILPASIVVILPYLVVRQERVLSKARSKSWPYVFLFVLLFLCTFVFLIGPAVFRSKCTVLGRLVSPAVLQPAFLQSGFALIIFSAVFQVFSIEFYDSASGWRGGEEGEGIALRFHLTGLASHSFLFGISFALLGVCLLLCEIHFWIASVVTFAVLLALVALTEIERELWARRDSSS